MNPNTDRDFYEGFLAEGSNGGAAMWELLFTLVWYVILLITWPIRIFLRRRR